MAEQFVGENAEQNAISRIAARQSSPYDAPDPYAVERVALCSPPPLAESTMPAATSNQATFYQPVGPGYSSGLAANPGYSEYPRPFYSASTAAPDPGVRNYYDCAPKVAYGEESNAASKQIPDGYPQPAAGRSLQVADAVPPLPVQREALPPRGTIVQSDARLQQQNPPLPADQAALMQGRSPVDQLLIAHRITPDEVTAFAKLHERSPEYQAILHSIRSGEQANFTVDSEHNVNGVMRELHEHGKGHDYSKEADYVGRINHLAHDGRLHSGEKIRVLSNDEISWEAAKQFYYNRHRAGIDATVWQFNPPPEQRPKV